MQKKEKTFVETGNFSRGMIYNFKFFSYNGHGPSLVFDRGSASAFIGALQYASGIVSSLLIAIFSKGTPLTMTWVILLFTAAPFLVAAAREHSGAIQ